MKLWTPSESKIKSSNLFCYLSWLKERGAGTFGAQDELYAWSINDPTAFWKSLWEFFEIKASVPAQQVLKNPERMPGAQFFPGARLNYAEHMLKFRDSKPALIFWGEKRQRREVTYEEIYIRVSQVAAELREWGLKPGDRVCGCVPNMPESIIAMLATAALGGIWSSCSPDFGTSGILDRFGQIEPKIFFVCDGYYFKDQEQDVLKKAAEVLQQLPSVEKVIVIPYISKNPDISKLPNAVNFDQLMTKGTSELHFEQLPFNHPLYIMFSSGTTGKPKCIVHSAGGVLIEHLKELVLHTDLKRTDKIFYQTTCGWMMWNWLVSSLSVGATLLLFDGAPFHDDGRILFDLATQEGMTIFGTNAKYISACEKQGLAPKDTHDLSTLTTVLSTGSPLAPESFEYVYDKWKKDICLSSISGGTDIVGCFALGTPMLPVYRGELQTRSLGLKVEVWDENGKSLIGEKGELVCTAPFPSMPVGFWNDPSGEKYHAAYFDRFPGVWHHGDYVELNSRGGMVFHGRSDSVLNPGGIRIGTGEIYRQVELIPEVLESVCVAQDWEGDVRVVLFVRMQPEKKLTDEIRDQIKTTIRKNTTSFHVPKKIIEVSDIPRTRSGKIVELAIREVIHGRPIKNIEALANPEALDCFRNLHDLKS